MKLIDAGFLYTEPHSRRIRIKLTVQGEVINIVKIKGIWCVITAKYLSRIPDPILSMY